MSNQVNTYRNTSICDPSTQQNMDGDSSTTILMVTRLGQTTTRLIPRREAYVWAVEMVNDCVSKTNATMEGELEKVIPVKQTVAGFQFKFVFSGVPDRLMKEVLIPGIEDKDCIVKMQSHDEAAEQRKASNQRLATLRRRSDQLADSAGDIADVVKTLMRMRGEGGSEIKRARFANRAMDVISITTQVAGANLQETRCDAE